jgi:hypothetical protein
MSMVRIRPGVLIVRLQVTLSGRRTVDFRIEPEKARSASKD